MFRYKILLLGALLIGFVFSGCAPVYIPNTSNAPMFGEKGELLVGAFGGTNGYDAQFAYAVSDHIVIVANGSYKANDFDSNAINEYHKHYFGEIGAGYYTQLTERARFECLGGYGFGQAETGYNFTFLEKDKGVAKGLYDRYFIQADLGTSSNFDYVNMGISIRGTYVNFYKFIKGTEVYEDRLSNFYIEPAVFVRAGWKYIKFQFQFGGSILTNSKDSEFDHQPFMISGGLVFTIPMMLAK
jgi:hypothetical protein